MSSEVKTLIKTNPLMRTGKSSLAAEKNISKNEEQILK
jgi:hypothetical protein